MNSPPGAPAASPFSRRTFLALTGVAVATTAVTADLLGPRDSAAATVGWGHPFAYRQAAGSRFGMRRGRMHQGQDYPATAGSVIHAVADGVVTTKGVLGTNGAYGNAVFITHAEGWSSRYAHMAEPSTLSLGQRVARGSRIGAVGNTGRSSGPHLHLELRLNGRAIDPFPYVQNAPLAAPTSNPLPAIIPDPAQENHMTYSINVNGNQYAIAPQYLSHYGTPAQAAVTRKVTSETDESHALSWTQFQDLLDGLGIPREVVQESGGVFDPQAGVHRGNGTWSREREILAALTRLGA